MPLHLLGKKSWNVYNTDNVERVRRDEANARAREEAEEQRMQEEDATRRIAILRGEEPAPLIQTPADEGTEKSQHVDDYGAHRERKRKRLRGEDETEREIRYAQEDAASGQKIKQRLGNRKGNDAPLLDHVGHIQLVSAPDEQSTRKADKNAEYEAEKAKKRKREEDRVTMRFSNAAGYQNGMQKPWYAAESSRSDEKNANVVLAGAEGKDVWGNEDPRRQEREMGRMASNDPFAMMQQAQKQLKRSEKDREKWQAEREKEIRNLDRDQERARRREKKHSRHCRGDDLEGFSLDAPAEKNSRGHHSRDDHRRHHHRHRHRSRERSKSRERKQR